MKNIILKAKPTLLILLLLTCICVGFFNKTLLRDYEFLGGDSLSPKAVQQGIIDEEGFQCAYCMSGFVMAAVGFLDKNPNPTREELAHGVSGNLCRCQDYDKILTALERGAEPSQEVARG